MAYCDECGAIGGILGRGNRYSEGTSPSAAMFTTNPTLTDPRIQPGPPRWEAGDYLPELRHSLCKSLETVHCFCD
jgi:hypothetical protein